MILKRFSAFILFLILTVFLYAYEDTGTASWYGGDFQGKKTANGEIFDTAQMTAAHKTLPFDTIVNVMNLDNGREVQVRINDRGPYVEGRIIDLSRQAAHSLGMLASGTARVKITTLDPSVTIIEYKNPLTFTIQVAAYSDLDNALSMKKRLTDAGFTPQARLSNGGVTKIMLEEIPQEKCYAVVKSLEAMNIRGVVIKQDL